MLDYGSADLICQPMKDLAVAGQLTGKMMADWEKLLVIYG